MSLATRQESRLEPASGLARARAQVSQTLDRFPYYLTPDEAHLLIDAANVNGGEMMSQ